MSHFQVLYKRALPHGIVVGVSLPGAGEPVPPEVLQRLHPKEAEFALTRRGFRQEQFVGGRLALREACRMLGRMPGPVLPDPRGAPIIEGRVRGSITHKRSIAVGLVARDPSSSLGVDLEGLERPRPAIASKVLRPAELAAVEALPPERQWTAIVTRFTVKEAIYKALAPVHERYINFDEAEVHPGTNGLAQVELFLKSGPTPVDLEAQYRWTNHGILATVRARWG